MPVLYLTEDDVRQVLTMDMALEAVETGLKKISLDEAVNIPRSRCQTDHSMLHVMAAVWGASATPQIVLAFAVRVSGNGAHGLAGV